MPFGGAGLNSCYVLTKRAFSCLFVPLVILVCLLPSLQTCLFVPFRAFWWCCFVLCLDQTCLFVPFRAFGDSGMLAPVSANVPFRAFSCLLVVLASCYVLTKRAFSCLFVPLVTLVWLLPSLQTCLFVPFRAFWWCLLRAMS